MSENVYRNLFKEGMWKNNQGLVALLGLCPLMAVTSTTVNGIGLGIATMLTLMITNVIVAATRQWIRSEIRIPMFVLIIASVVSVIELMMNAHLHALYKILGIFVPLIVTNCTVIGRAEAFASRNPVAHSLMDGFSMGLGFTAVLTVMGMLREILGYGTLFRQAHLMLGGQVDQYTIHVFQDYHGFLLAIMPPGAFMALAVLIAIKNRLDRLATERRKKAVKVELQTGDYAGQMSSEAV